jgi:carbamate kinase
VDAGILVICTGGGGIPVAQASPGIMEGVEAVIDKDLAAALLARELRADALLLLTDVEAVFSDWGTKASRPIDIIAPAQLRRMAFAPGSMGPKVEAACRFVESGGHLAAIGRIEDAPALLNGRAGTIVRVPGPRPGRP